MERTGSTNTHRTIAYIKDALFELQSEVNTSNKRKIYDIVANQRYYSYPSDFVKLENVYVRDSDYSPSGSGEVMPATINATDYTVSNGFSISSGTLVYQDNSTLSEAYVPYTSFQTAIENNTRYYLKYTVTPYTANVPTSSIETVLDVSGGTSGTVPNTTLNLDIFRGTYIQEFTTMTDASTGGITFSVGVSPGYSFIITSISIQKVVYKYLKIPKILGDVIADKDFA